MHFSLLKALTFAAVGIVALSAAPSQNSHRYDHDSPPHNNLNADHERRVDLSFSYNMNPLKPDDHGNAGAGGFDDDSHTGVKHIDSRDNGGIGSLLRPLASFWGGGLDGSGLPSASGVVTTVVGGGHGVPMVGSFPITKTMISAGTGKDGVPQFGSKMSSVVNTPMELVNSFLSNMLGLSALVHGSSNVGRRNHDDDDK